MPAIQPNFWLAIAEYVLIPVAVFLVIAVLVIYLTY